ncbi:MAG TPA: PH domain-containing protein [Massilibacterium sp.]|nr:PH domain-containing protein [Massilibacterium sp.]
MRNEPREKINIRAIKVWKKTALLSLLISLLIPIGISIGVYFFEWKMWIPFVVLAIILLYFMIDFFIFIPLRYKRYRYEVNENEIYIQYGIWFITRTVIPMVRVQHVDTIQGPFLRKEGLATVTVSTAAGGASIPALTEEDANDLRDQISILARVVDEDD